MPDANSVGMLEDLVIRAVQGDEIMRCIDEYFKCLDDTNIVAKPNRLPKAITRVYIETALYELRASI